MYQVYQVMADDNLSDIANKFNTTIDEIRNLNGFQLNSILTPGTYIVVPKFESGLYNVYNVEKGDNLYSIAQKYNISLKNLLLINGLKDSEYIYPGQKLLIPKENITMYITGTETLKDISNKTGLTESQIISQNDNIYLVPDQIITYRK